MIHSSRGIAADYLVAQYMEDVFRREVRNIGVLVRKGNEYAAKFFGEIEPGVVDGRRIKSLVAPDVYRQWVQYWRRILATDADPFNALTRTPQANYPLLDGGSVWDTGDDAASSVADFLYTALVAEDGLSGAYSIESELSGSARVSPMRLNREIESTFRSINILASADEELALVRHPVRQKPEIRGTTSEPHVPQFSQQNGRLFVMETVDFSEKSKERAKDHAGLTSFMFEDLRDAMQESVFPIALVRFGTLDDSVPEVRYGLSMLHKAAGEVINWDDADARAHFVEQRRNVAMMTN